jgi:hypothetical protein
VKPGAFLLAVLALPARTAPASAEPSIAERARTHWSFQPVRRPAIPRVRDESWVRTPIDSFLLARLESERLKPAPRADRLTLLRRAAFDLTGLPPGPDEQQAFLADRSPDAWERLVDRLLASPAYGERWGRHWLDVARYADTNGYERDGDKPFAWRYRDRVIESFNEDLPFDRFAREQIAGDELPGSTAREQVAATFLRLGTWDDEPANAAVDRFDQLDDVLGVTAAAFLAQTIRCARCHDHKFEPFSQKDYYRLLAVFTPLKRPQRGRQDLTRPVGTREQLASYQRALARYEESLAELRRRADQVKAPIRERVLADKTKFTPEVRRAFTTSPPRRTSEQKTLVRKHQVLLAKEVALAATPEEKVRLANLARQAVYLKLLRPPDLPQAYLWYEDGPKAPPTRLLRRGNPNLVGREVQPGLPAIIVLARPEDGLGLAPAQPPPPRPLPTSTGRRLWLANQVARPDNPLTARVIVNRLWLWHFGRGLVGTPSDFGLMGEPPSHPELLDWLSSEFTRGGWSLKRLHRQILLSNAYQTASDSDGPDSPRKLTLFGRWRQRRLEAEAVRDAMLAVSGRLNRQAGGPGVYPRLPAAVHASQSRPGQGWGRSDDAQSSRRSVYVFAKRSLALPELALLDSPDTNDSCEQRPRSTTAPQALTFLNGAFTHEQANHFADRLRREAGPDREKQVRRAFALALGRPPEQGELEKSLAFLGRQDRQIESDNPVAKADARRAALASFCLVLFNTNEFFYPG